MRQFVLFAAETICAKNVGQRNRWRRNGRAEMVAPKRRDPHKALQPSPASSDFRIGLK